jgi:hypothetical protein
VKVKKLGVKTRSEEFICVPSQEAKGPKAMRRELSKSGVSRAETSTWCSDGLLYEQQQTNHFLQSQNYFSLSWL